MQTTPRIRVWSVRISRVLLYICFYRGLLGNKEERPTCRDYIEMITHRAIFYHLENSRSHENEAEAQRGLAQGARPRDQGARAALVSNQDSLSELRSTNLRIKDNRSINVGLIRRPTFTWGDYISRPPGPWRRHKFIIELRRALEGIPLL